MGTSLEDLKMLQAAEAVADEIWREVIGWKVFERDVVGGQLARAADSIGANIAESFGRFHYGEKLQFLYYARGSLFEAKYWLNRAQKRKLLSVEQVNSYARQLTELAYQINAFARSLKSQRKNRSNKRNTVGEGAVSYVAASVDEFPLFDEAELNWLQTVFTNSS